MAATPKLSVRSVAPGRAAPGRDVVVHGAGFRHVKRVAIGKSRARFHVLSTSRIRVRVPGKARSGRVAVTTSSRTARSARALIVSSTATSLTPTSGPIYSTVTITGSGFTSPATVSFNGASTTGTVKSTTSITATVPSTASTGPVKVTSAGSTTSPGTFTVTPGLKLSTTAGPPTTTLSVYGGGFGANELVDLYVGTTNLAVVATNATGNFAYGGFTIPASAQPGTTWISASGRRTGIGSQSAFIVRTAWARTHYGHNGAGYNPYENTITTANAGQLGLAWNFSFSSASPDNAPVIANGYAYIASRLVLYCLNATTGALVWSQPSTFTYSAPTIANNVVYLGDTTGKVTARNGSTGATIRVYDTGVSSGGSFDGGVDVSGGYLYFGYASTLYKYDVTTGAKVWSYTASSGAIESTPAVANGLVFITTTTGVVAAVSQGSGSSRWTATGNTSSTSAAVVNGIVYTAAGTAVTARDFDDGSLLWSYTTTRSIGASPAVANGEVFVNDNNGDLYALDAVTGELDWSDTVVGGSYDDDLAIANNVLYVVTVDRIVAYSVYGSRLWTYVPTQYGVAPAIADGVLYTANAGSLNAFSLAGGRASNNGQSAPRPRLSGLRSNHRLRVRG